VKKFLSIGFLLLCIFSCERQDLLEQGTLVIGIEGNPTNLDPRLATDAYSMRIDSLIFNGLTRPDENGEATPDLAERWEMPDDRTYIFHLRKEVTFHNGSKFTSADVLSTFESLRDPGFGSPLFTTFELVEKMSAQDPYTLRIRLREPHAPFLSQLSVGIAPKDTMQKTIGTGPFRLKRFSPGSSVVLSANEKYFRGPPRLKGAIFKIVPNDLTRILELRKGSIHLLQNNIPPDSVSDLENNPSLAILKRPGSSYAYLGFNLEDPILKNRLVRQAIAHSINREEIISHVLRGLATPATGLLPSFHWAYEGDVERYSYEPEKAKKLLDQAGHPSRNNGPRMRLSYKTSVSPLSKRIAEVLLHQIGEVGVTCDMRSYEWGTFFSDIKSGNFQLFTLLWVGVVDPDHFYYAFHSLSLPPRGANRVRYRNPELDSLLEKGRRALAKEERKEIYSRVQKILARDLPYISLWHLYDVVAMRKELKGFVIYPGGEFYSLENARLEHQ